MSEELINNTVIEMGGAVYLGKGDKGDKGDKGADGQDGKSAYASAQDGGYSGTEAQFNSDLANVGSCLNGEFNSATIIPANSDINNYLDAGNFYVKNLSTAQTLSNLPESRAGRLFILQTSQPEMLFQIYFCSHNAANKIYFRFMQGATFSEWSRIGTYDQIQTRQTIDNLVTSWESTPSDSKYPSEKLVYDRIISCLTGDENFAETIPDNSDFNDLTTPGNYRVTNTTHARTMANIPITIAGRLFVMRTSYNNMFAQIYFAANNDGKMIYYRSRGTTGVWSAWDRVGTYGQIQTRQTIDNLVTSFSETPSDTKYPSEKLVYDSFEKFNNGIFLKYVYSGTKSDEAGGLKGSGANSSVAHIKIKIQQKNGGFIEYFFANCRDDSKNANCWRIAYLYDLPSINAEETTTTRASAAGEFECALRIIGRDDFSGGITHGDEQLTSIKFFADGEEIGAEDIAENQMCREFRVVRTSDLYDPADHTTKIAEHGCEYIFKDGKCTINQSVKWLVAVALDNCFLAMLPIRKSHSQYRYDDTDFEIVENTETDYGYAFPNCTKFTEYTPNKTITDFYITNYPKGLVGGDRGSVTDNSGNDYNKCYFKVCGNGQSSAVGELWKSTTVYEMRRA